MKTVTRIIALLVLALSAFVSAPAFVSGAADYYVNGESQCGLREVYIRGDDGYYFGVVDDEGTVIIAPTRGSIYVGNDNGYIITNKAGRQGAGDFDLKRAGKSEIIDASGKVVLSVDMYLCYYDGFCRVLNDEQKYGFFDTSGRNVTGFVFDQAEDYSEGLAAVSVSGKWGYMDTDQQMIIPAVYEEASPFKAGFAEVKTTNGELVRLENPIQESRDINIYINEAWLYTEKSPFIESGRTMIPIRSIAEAFGMNVQWIPSASEVILQNSELIIRFQIGSTEASINFFDDGFPSRNVMLDTAPTIFNGRTYIPLRFIAENLGCSVTWEPNSRSVFMTNLWRAPQ